MFGRFPTNWIRAPQRLTFSVHGEAYARSNMQGKEIHLPLSWAYRNEGIDGLVEVSLTPEIQKSLGCKVMEDVFLEYPWAYIPREEVIRLLRRDDSPLLPFKEDIDKYEGESFLLGYASTELISSEFVICVTERARDELARRNKAVKKELDHQVHGMFYKTPKPWVSNGSELEIGENVTRRQRPLFEVEISMPHALLGNDRELTDRKATDAEDAYMEIVPQYEKFDLVPMSRLTTAVQTNLPGREAGVQTHFGFPKNAWTQYGYEYLASETPAPEIPSEDDDEKVEDEEAGKDEGLIQAEKTTTPRNALSSEKAEGETELEESEAPDPVNLFIEKYAEEMIDVINYNAAMNLHVHDIDELVLKGKETRPTEEVVFEELQSFIDLSLTTGKVISDLSWHPTLTGVAVVCYSDVPNCDLVRGPSVIRNAKSCFHGGSGSVVLVWSFTDSMSPRLELDHDKSVSTVSFCPFRPDILIGGCETGHVVLWDFSGRLTKCSLESCCNEEPEAMLSNDTPIGTDRRLVPAISLAAASNDFKSHHRTIRQIQWLPPYHRVEADGRLTVLTENTNLQFLTASEDGCIAVWDLSWEPRLSHSSVSERGLSKLSKTLHEEFGTPVSEFKKIDGLFRPAYRIYIQGAKEIRNLPVLSLFIQSPLISYKEVWSVHRPRTHPLAAEKDQESRFQTQVFQSSFLKTDRECPKQFWVGSSEGDFVSCAWEGHEFTEVASSENFKHLGWSRVHDGPVTRISQSPHLPEVLLTVGGRVFAVWNQDFLQSPLLLRKCEDCYTACCWTSRPGVFLIARSNGDVETWDLCTSTNECLAVQSLSGKRITGLYPHILPLKPSVFGVCDYNGSLRIFKEPHFFSEDQSTRIEWLKEFVGREVKRKQEFTMWETNYLKTDPHCLERRAARAADEAKRKHEEARATFQKEQEELAKLEEKRRARLVPKSKAEKWRESDLERMRSILLAKKGFDPRELEATRKPLVQQDEERSRKLKEAGERVKRRETYFKDTISLELAKLPEKKSSTSISPVTTPPDEKSVCQKRTEGKLNYERIRVEAERKMRENFEPHVFDPKKLSSDGRQRRRGLDLEYQKRSRREERIQKMKANLSG